MSRAPKSPSTEVDTHKFEQHKEGSRPNHPLPQSVHTLHSNLAPWRIMGVAVLTSWFYEHTSSRGGRATLPVSCATFSATMRRLALFAQLSLWNGLQAAFMLLGIGLLQCRAHVQRNQVDLVSMRFQTIQITKNTGAGKMSTLDRQKVYDSSSHAHSCSQRVSLVPI